MKTTKEVDISEFELFLPSSAGQPSYSELYPDTPLCSVQKQHIAFTELAMQKMRGEEKDQCIMARRGETFYVAIVPKMSSIKGFNIYKPVHGKIYIANKGNKWSSKTEKGLYELGEPVFSGGIDWFELMPFSNA